MTKFFLTATIILAVSFRFAMCKSKEKPKAIKPATADTGLLISTIRTIRTDSIANPFNLLDSQLKLAVINMEYMKAHDAELQANLDYIRTDYSKKYKRIFYKHQAERVRLAKEGGKLQEWIDSHRPSPAPVPDTSKPGESCGLHGGYNIYTVDNTPKFIRYFRPVMIGSNTSFSIHCSIDSVMRIWRNGIYPAKLKPSPQPIPDTTIKPRYEYYYKLMIPVNKFSPPLDTINMVLDKLGKTLTVDQADELRAIVVRQLNNFIGRPVVDSVLVKGGKP